MKDTKKKTAHTSKLPGALKPDGTDLGLIKIHENVIASVVRRAACSVNGVIRLAGSPLIDNIAEIIGNRRISDRAIGVNINGDSVAIDLKVNLAYGVHVPTVAATIQTAVMEDVEKITGMVVTTVNVIVQELGESEEQEEI